MTRRPPKPPDRESKPRNRERSRQSSTIRTLRDIPREPLDLTEDEDSNSFDIELETSTDRGVAILLAANVERELERLLLMALAPSADDTTVSRLVNRDGALSSFCGNNWLGYANGLYDKAVLDALERIRRIRNVFAHGARHMNFSILEIENECNKFRPIEMPSPQQNEKLRNHLENNRETARNKYVFICIAVLVYITDARAKLARAPADNLRSILQSQTSVSDT
jgi:hypothetical protein